MHFLKNPLNAISAILLLASTALWFALPLQAQESRVNVAASTPEGVLCLDEIAESAAVLTQDVVDFLNEHYLSEEPNSTLIDDAFAKFDEYQSRMFGLVEQFGGAEGGKNITGELAERDRCRSVINDQIRTVEQLLINHNTQSAGAKKSYALVTKLKEVNEKLRGLNRDFGEMYGGFKTFVDKLQNTVQ